MDVLEYVAILLARPDDLFGFIIDLFAFCYGLLDEFDFFRDQSSAKGDR